MVQVSPPRTGPCDPWATSADVAAIGVNVDDLDPNKLDLNLTISSELLFARSAFQYPGTCTETIRPITRSSLCEHVALWSDYPYLPDLIEGVWYNIATDQSPLLGVIWEGGHAIPRIDLGQYPVVEIVNVKIDGSIFTYSGGAHYRLDDWRYLVRTDGSFWPQAQNLLLDDGQIGTWSVSLKYGQPAPQMAVSAAAQLAYQLTLHTMGDQARCQLPLRVQAVSRQGVTYSMANVMDVLNKQGGTGLYFVDLFLKTVNPDGLQRPARVATPDLKPHHRLGSTN